MPVRIVHKHTHKEYIIPIKDWNSQTAKENYTLLQITDTGELYHFVMGKQNSYIGITEYTDYLQLASVSPNAYIYKPIPDIDNTIGVKSLIQGIKNQVDLGLLPPQTPNNTPIVPAIKKAHAGTTLLKKLWSILCMIMLNDYIKYTIIGLIVSIIIWYFGFNKTRS